MENRELLKSYRIIQDTPGFKTRCPRCGENTMLEGQTRNALSRHEDIYVCPRCGNEEAVLDMMGKMKPLTEWYAIKLLRGEPVYQHHIEGSEKECYLVETSKRFRIKARDIDDIMCASLEGGVTQLWCSEARVVGDYLGEYASDQISRGGSLIFYDLEEDAEYELTLDKFMKGLAKYVAEGPENILDDGWVEPCDVDAIIADAIVQYALFDDVIYG